MVFKNPNDPKIKNEYDRQMDGHVGKMIPPYPLFPNKNIQQVRYGNEGPVVGTLKLNACAKIFRKQSGKL
jgi:hypothetical protein